MTIRSLFDPATSTFTYLVLDPKTRRAALIDPVIEHLERDLALVRDLDLTLAFALDTHIHADHVTSAGALRDRTGASTGRGAAYGPGCADLALREGDVLTLGDVHIEVRETPGHTVGCLSFVVRDGDRIEGVMTGDALFVRGTGRTDFQGGSPTRLYHSIRERLFTLPDATLVHPGHDYRGHHLTTIGEEKRLNPRIAEGKTEAEFVRIMSELKLPPPQRLDVAVPANIRCGRPPTSPDVSPN